MVAYLEKAKVLNLNDLDKSCALIQEHECWHFGQVSLYKGCRITGTVSVEFLAELSIKQQLGVMELEQETSWMDPIIEYSKNDKLLENKTEARVLRLRGACNVIYDDKW